MKLRALSNKLGLRRRRALANVDADKRILEERLKIIERVTEAARSNWFWFFGILGYFSLTIIGLDDAKLFSLSATATLPILNFSVDLESFLFLAPGLITVIYIYLHGQIGVLWNELSVIPDHVKGPSGDPDTYPVVTRLPVWLLIEFALLVRDFRRGKMNGSGAVCPSLIGTTSAWAMGALVWLAAPLLLLWLWWRTLVVHAMWLSGWHVSCLLICLATCWMSGKQLYEAMR